MGCRKSDRLTTTGDFAGILVEHQIPHNELGVVNSGNTRALHQPVQTNHNFFHRKRLGHIVIGTSGKPFDAVIHRIFRGQEKARHFGVKFPDAVQQFQTVETGHHNIKHQHIGAPVAGNS